MYVEMDHVSQRSEVLWSSNGAGLLTKPEAFTKEGGIELRRDIRRQRCEKGISTKGDQSLVPLEYGEMSHAVWYRMGGAEQGGWLGPTVKGYRPGEASGFYLPKGKINHTLKQRTVLPRLRVRSEAACPVPIS